MPTTITDDLDAPCFSARDILELCTLIRDLKPRDGLRTLEDSILDLTNRATP